MPHPALRRGCLVLASVTLAAAAFAQAPPQEPVAPLQDQPNPVDQAAELRGLPVRSLTLGDALRIGRVGNVGLRAAELLPEQARMDLMVAEAGFVPEFYGDGGYANRQTPSRNAFSPSLTTKVIDAAVGWRQRVVTGGLFDLAFRPGAFDYSGSPAFPSQQYSTEWVASFRQPLLRGAWSDYSLAPINQSRFRVNQANSEYERSVQDTLLQIVQAYWELAYVRANYRVVASALVVAEQQLRITDERIRVQTLAPRDRIADQSEVARRQEERITAENAIRQREDDLRRLLFDGSDARMWQINVRTVSPIDIEPAADELDYVALVEVAMSHRPDLRAVRSGIAAAEQAQVQAERDLLPKLDLVSAYSTDGVSNSTDPTFNQAWDASVQQRFPDWSVRLEFAIPLGNQAARARAQRAGLEVERQRRLLHAATLDVTRQVRDAVRSLQTLALSIRASAESVRLATSNLDTEQAKLRAQVSTAFEVQRRNQELREARSRSLRNQLDYHTAQSRLLHAQGLLQASVE